MCPGQSEPLSVHNILSISRKSVSKMHLCSVIQLSLWQTKAFHLHSSVPSGRKLLSESLAVYSSHTLIVQEPVEVCPLTTPQPAPPLRQHPEVQRKQDSGH